MASPVSGTLRSMGAAGRGDYAESAMEGVGVLAPAAIAAKFGAPAARAVVETMTGTGNALADTGSRAYQDVISRLNQTGDMGVLYSNPLASPFDMMRGEVKPSVAEMRRQANIERFGYDPNDVPIPAPDQQAGSGILSDYAGQHRAPTRDEGAPAFNLAGDVYPDDIYSQKAVQYYGTGSDTMDKETMHLLHSLRGSPDADVTIYRAVPRGVDNLNAGDWVTVNREYAKDHGESALGGDFDIIEKNVKAGDIFTNGDSIHEFGYDPVSPSLPAPRNESEAMAQKVLEMRAAGNASEVTDEMMAAADDQYMYFNTPIDMGVAERVRRSEDMGADPFGDYYHGTAREGYVDTTDIVGFEPGRVGDRWNADKRGFSMTSALQDANYYAVRGDSSKGNLGDGMIYPLVDMSKNPMRMTPPDQYSGTIGTWDERPDDTYPKLDAGGYDAVDIYDDGVNMRVSMDPTNIRSRFARFDPEFRHLRNLSAGVGGLGVAGAGLLPPQQAQAQPNLIDMQITPLQSRR